MPDRRRVRDPAGHRLCRGHRAVESERIQADQTCCEQNKRDRHQYRPELFCLFCGSRGPTTVRTHDFDEFPAGKLAYIRPPLQELTEINGGWLAFASRGLL
jgi:hypothetical protein